jgi:hypothetical protein
MSSKLMSADEKRDRKNALARIRRMNAKNIEGKRNAVTDTEMPEPDSVPEPEPELPEPEPMPPTAEEIEMKRKEAIAEKRRQSLILARSKITPKNVIRKDAIDKVNKKDMELNDAKREAEEIKRKAYEDAEATKKKAAEDVEVMKSLVKTKIISDAEPKKKIRSKSAAPPRHRESIHQTPPQPQPVQPVQPVQQQQRPDLIQLSYTEQLKQRLREQQLQRLMSDTFG